MPETPPWWNNAHCDAAVAVEGDTPTATRGRCCLWCAGILCLDVLSVSTEADERDLAAPRGLEFDTRQEAAAVAADILSLERAATVDVAIVQEF